MSKVVRAMNREREKLMTLDELLNSQNTRPPPTERLNQSSLSRSLTAADKHSIDKHRKKSFDMSESVLRRSDEAIQRVDDLISATTYYEPDTSTPVELKDEISRLQHALVDKYRGQQKLVSGAQFRSTATKDTHGKCEKCDLKDHSIKKAKDQIRSLKFQLSQTEDKYYSKAPRHSLNDTESNKQLLDMTAERDALEMKYQSTLQEISALKTRLQVEDAQTSSLQTQLSSLRIDYTNYQNMTSDKLNSLQLSLSDTASQLHARETHGLFLSKELNLKSERISDLEKRLQELINATARPDTSDERLRKLEQSLNQSRQSENDLRNQMQQLEEQLVSSKQEVDRAAQHKNNAEDKIQHLEKLLEESRREIEALEEDKKSAANVITEQANTITDQKIDLASTSASLAALNTDHETLKQRLADMIQRFTTETERNSQLLAKSITNSVRLCVVAPTVNVHVADKKMKFRNSVPTEELSAFLEREVLSKYTFLYEQEAEGISPIGTPIQPWITQLLAEMQASIEEHIKRAMMKGAS